MNFLIDAQLPRRMTAWLAEAGGNALQTLDLPDRNRTTDAEICAVADGQPWVVVTKDADFVDSQLLLGRPRKLPLVSTGNISNRQLQFLVTSRLSDIVREFGAHSFLELGPAGLVVRDSDGDDSYGDSILISTRLPLPRRDPWTEISILSP